MDANARAMETATSAVITHDATLPLMYVGVGLRGLWTNVVRGYIKGCQAHDQTRSVHTRFVCSPDRICNWSPDIDHRIRVVSLLLDRKPNMDGTVGRMCKRKGTCVCACSAQGRGVPLPKQIVHGRPNWHHPQPFLNIPIPDDPTDVVTCLFVRDRYSFPVCFPVPCCIVVALALQGWQ